MEKLRGRRVVVAFSGEGEYKVRVTLLILALFSSAN